jgi:hypothetical protein
MGSLHDNLAGGPTFRLEADELQAPLDAASTEAVLALGLVRVMSLMPFHDPALDELEQHIANIWNSVLELRRVVTDARVLACRERRGRR